MLRQMLEECQKGTKGVGFNEVVLMVTNTASTAEVYMMMDDLRFTEKEDIVTFMDTDGTHLHLNLDKVREVEFLHQMNERNLPSYSVWFRDAELETVFRIYLRKSDNDETNQPRHDLFMHLLEKYGNKVQVNG